MESGKLPRIKVLIMHHFMENDSLTGYSFRKALLDKGITISNGSLYPILNQLEERGILISRMDGKKKIYTETAKARKMRDNIMHFAPKDVSIHFMQLAQQMACMDWEKESDIIQLKSTIDDFSDDVNKLLM